MIKSELVAAIFVRHPKLARSDAEGIVNTVLAAISAALTAGNRVELRGFGAFSVKQKRARIGRNPRTGEVVSVIAKRAPAFRTGKEMRKRLASENDPQPDANI